MKIRMRMVSCLLTAAMLSGMLSACSSTEKTIGRENGNSSTEPQTTATATENHSYESAFEKFETALMKQMEEDSIPGASIAVLENSELIHFKGLGMANNEENIPISKDTLFSTGSVGKVYVTAAALKLAQDGKLQLDDPVTKYLPEFTMADPRYKDITVRMLLNYTSGLPGDAHAIGSDWASSTFKDNYGIGHLNELTNLSLKSKPGESSNYSNTGFTLAQYVVEAASGQDYLDYLKEQFFRPMGLSNTYSASYGDIDDNRARFYDAYGNLLPREYSGASTAGAGGLISTPEDTCRFMEQILSPEAGILNEESIALLRGDESLTSKFPQQEYLNALGWDNTSPKFQDIQVLSKAGGTTNYSCQVLTAPEAGLTITVSTSQFNYYIYDAVDDLMRDLLIAKGLMVPSDDMPELPEQSQETESRSDYSGYYYGDDGLFGVMGLQKVDIQNNTMIHSVWTGEWVPLGEYTYREDGSYGSLDEDTNEYTGYSFKEVDSNIYLMKKIVTPEYENTVAAAMQLSVGAADEAWQKRSGSLWLRTNIEPSDYQAGACLTIMETVEGVDGYVLMNGGFPLLKIKDSSTATGIDNVIGHHQAEVTFAGDTLQWMGMNYIHASEAAELETGKTTVNFERANTAKWFAIPKNMKISAAANHKDVRIIVYDAELNQIFDNLGQSGEIEIPEGSFMMLCSAENGYSIDIAA